MKALKIITIELIILVITAMSFIGLYKKDEYRVKNLIPEYKLGINFTEQRVISMKVDDTVKETLIYDAEGNLVENQEEGIEYTEENGYRIEEVKTNDNSLLTEENYEKTKDVILNRLHNLKAGEYVVNLNKETGEIKVKIQENDNSDMISYYLTQNGKIELADAETGELLLDERHLKDVGLLFGSDLNEEGKNESYVYLQIKFDKEGTNKLEELSKIYIETTTEIENENGEKEEQIEEKKLTITLNGTNMGSTIITNILYNNSITLALGTSTDTEEFSRQTENATNVVKILKSGTLPIAYTLEENTLAPYQEARINIQFYAFAVLVITILLSVYLIIKYKTRGLLASNLQVGFLATILIVLRYTNVIINETGICGIIVSIILNYIFLIQILKQKNSFNEALIKHFLSVVPIYIISILLAFSNSTILNSFGMTLTWGSIFIYIFNIIFTKPIIDNLKEGKNEKK